MAKIIKLYGLTTILLLVLCGVTNAQSTSFSEDNSVNDDPRLVPTEPMIHGFGATGYSRFYPDSSYAEAYRRAIEDLRSNLFTSVYLEWFKTTQVVSNFEFAILDSIDMDRVVKVDSSANENWVYFLTGVKNSGRKDRRPTASLADVTESAGNWKDRNFNPVRMGNYWVSSGFEEFSTYAPYKSWAKSKLDALETLAQFLQTRVESLQKTENSFMEEATYISSKVIFKNIIVLKRHFTGSECHTLLAVHKDDINLLN